MTTHPASDRLGLGLRLRRVLEDSGTRGKHGSKEQQEVEQWGKASDTVGLSGKLAQQGPASLEPSKATEGDVDQPIPMNGAKVDKETEGQSWEELGKE